jgi:hypothetical protein
MSISYKEISTGKGVLKYRLPNIAEGHKYLALVHAIENTSDLFIIKGNIIQKMGELIQYSDLGYSSYDEVLNDKENMRSPISTIAQEVLDDILELLGKKN